MATIQNITIIGAGNVAFHLASLFYEKGIVINEIYNRTSTATVDEIVEKTGARYVSSMKDLSPLSDLYIVAVKDDAISEVVAAFPFKDKFIVHTAGSISLNVFSSVFSRFGSLYALQTFSKIIPMEYSTIPWCVEANNVSDEKALYQLASLVSEKVNYITSSQRLHLHVAAVFACNFTNFMQVIAKDICLSNQVDYDLLKPLIQQTVQKGLENNPSEVQTGPARRKDEQTMQNHLKLLSKTEDYATVYAMLSNVIVKRYHESHDG